MTFVEVITDDDAVERARRFAAYPRRTLVGITGAPGAGKSTLAERLAREVPGCVVVPMDGFHLAHSVLKARGLVGVKGAPHTFDAEGYAALLARVRESGSRVWAPEFRRDLEDAIAGAIEVPPETRLVVTEGNYLLLEDGPWPAVRRVLDEVWYVEVPEELRRDWLVERHERHGKTPELARVYALGSDEDNARLITRTRDLADVLVRPGRLRPTDVAAD